MCNIPTNKSNAILKYEKEHIKDGLFAEVLAPSKHFQLKSVMMQKKNKMASKK